MCRVARSEQGNVEIHVCGDLKNSGMWRKVGVCRTVECVVGMLLVFSFVYMCYIFPLTFNYNCGIVVMGTEISWHLQFVCFFSLTATLQSGGAPPQRKHQLHATYVQEPITFTDSCVAPPLPPPPICAVCLIPAFEWTVAIVTRYESLINTYTHCVGS